QDTVLPLCRQAVVARYDRPAVGQGADIFTPGVDHGFDREDHARLQFHAGTRLAVMQHLRVLMEFAAHAVATVFAHNRKALLFGVLLDGMPDVAQRTARTHLFDAQPHAFVSSLGKAPGKYRWFADVVHAAGIAKPAILDDRDVDIH